MGGSLSDLACLAPCRCTCTPGNAACCSSSLRVLLNAVQDRQQESPGQFCADLRAAVMLRGSQWVTLGGTSLYHILAGTGHLEVGGNVCTYTGSAAHAWVVGVSEFDQSGCGKVLWGAASTIRASPAGQGKLKQRNAFPSSLCSKDPLKLMGVSIQNFILFSRGPCVCV